MGTGEDAARRIRAAVELELERIAEDLLGRAQRDAPVETGRLRASGALTVETIGERIEAEISFSTPYAARQHEETTWKHPLGGKPKYLEDNLKAMAPAYAKRLADAARRAL